MTKEAALYQFWSSFSLPAYEENSVPAQAEFPYISYEVITDSFGSQIGLTASIWYHTDSWVQLNAKAQEIADRLGEGGLLTTCDGGALWLQKGQPWAQSLTETDQSIKRKYLNITAEFLTAT